MPSKILPMSPRDARMSLSSAPSVDAHLRTAILVVKDRARALTIIRRVHQFRYRLTEIISIRLVTTRSPGTGTKTTLAVITYQPRSEPIPERKIR